MSGDNLIKKFDTNLHFTIDTSFTRSLKNHPGLISGAVLCIGDGEPITITTGANFTNILSESYVSYLERSYVRGRKMKHTPMYSEGSEFTIFLANHWCNISHEQLSRTGEILGKFADMTIKNMRSFEEQVQTILFDRSADKSGFRIIETTYASWGDLHGFLQNYSGKRRFKSKKGLLSFWVRGNHFEIVDENQKCIAYISVEDVGDKGVFLVWESGVLLNGDFLGAHDVYEILTNEIIPRANQERKIDLLLRRIRISRAKEKLNIKYGNCFSLFSKKEDFQMKKWNLFQKIKNRLYRKPYIWRSWRNCKHPKNVICKGEMKEFLNRMLLHFQNCPPKDANSFDLKRIDEITQVCKNCLKKAKIRSDSKKFILNEKILRKGKSSLDKELDRLSIGGRGNRGVCYNYWHIIRAFCHVIGSSSKVSQNELRTYINSLSFLWDDYYLPYKYAERAAEETRLLLWR